MSYEKIFYSLAGCAGFCGLCVSILADTKYQTLLAVFGYGFIVFGVIILILSVIKLRSLT